MPQRNLSLDHLRSTLTALIFFMHVAMTYGGSGSWFYNEITNTHARSSVLLTLYILISNAYLLNFFFLIAGYFTPASLERKGFAPFLKDRFLRLGVPFLLFCLVLAPVTMALVSHSEGKDFLSALHDLYLTQTFINGPMWFAEALLFFSIGYCLWSAFRKRTSVRKPAPVPSAAKWILACLAVGLAALILRQFFPIDRRVFGLWLGNFAPYLFFFCIGIKAWQSDWLDRFSWKQARASILLAAFALLALPFALTLFYAHGGTANTVRGLSWINIFYAFWEPVVGFGLVAALLLFFRAYVHSPSALWTWLDRRAYAVYVIHPLVLVIVCLAFRHWHAPALVKFICVGSLGCAATWIVADPLVRIPGLRRIF